MKKHTLRIAAYGDADEANAAIGLALAAMPRGAKWRALRATLEHTQHDLFRVGSALATPPGKTFKNLPAVEERHAARLERAIDAMERRLPPLREFVLPGGSLAGAALHLARGVARRAERSATALAAKESVPAEILVYLNRLSDFLFVAAREANRLAGVKDVPWRK